MSRTTYAKQNWLPYLREHSVGASSGTVSAMRRTLWGYEAYVVRCHKRIFKVDKETFEKVSSSEK